MSVWSKSFYAPVSGVWHDIVNAMVDTRLSFFQIANLSPDDEARVVVAIGASGDEPIIAPTGLSLTETGEIGLTTREYVVTAVKADGRETDASASISVTSSPEELNVSNYHTLAWDAVTGAVKYRLYCRTGGSESTVLNVIETEGLTAVNDGSWESGEKWPWINMTGVVALLTWTNLAPGTGIEPISRPVSFAIGDKLMLFTTGEISAFVSGEV